MREVGEKEIYGGARGKKSFPDRRSKDFSWSFKREMGTNKKFELEAAFLCNRLECDCFEGIEKIAEKVEILQA